MQNLTASFVEGTPESKVKRIIMYLKGIIVGNVLTLCLLASGDPLKREVGPIIGPSQVREKLGNRQLLVGVWGSDKQQKS